MPPEPDDDFNGDVNQAPRPPRGGPSPALSRNPKPPPRRWRSHAIVDRDELAPHPIEGCAATNLLTLEVR